MKPFLGIEVSADGQDSKINGEEFLVIRAAADEGEGEEKTKKKVETYVDPLPPLWRTVRIVCGTLALVFIALICRWYMAGISKVEEIYAAYPWAFWAAGAVALIWLVLNITGSSLAYKNASDYPEEQEEDEEDENAETIDLEIPEDAVNLDLLAFNYLCEEGEIKAVMADEDSASEYFNCAMDAYADGEYLYFASIDEKYAIPLSSLISIETVNEKIAIPDWNKETPPTKGEYKEFGLTVDNLGRVIIPTYHILGLEHGGERWGIYFPSYELPTVEKITGLKA